MNPKVKIVFDNIHEARYEVCLDIETDDRRWLERLHLYTDSDCNVGKPLTTQDKLVMKKVKAIRKKRKQSLSKDTNIQVNKQGLWEMLLTLIFS